MPCIDTRSGKKDGYENLRLLPVIGVFCMVVRCFCRRAVQGKIKLKDEIVVRTNRLLANGHIKDVYFTEFIVQ